MNSDDRQGTVGPDDHTDDVVATALFEPRPDESGRDEPGRDEPSPDDRAANPAAADPVRPTAAPHTARRGAKATKVTKAAKVAASEQPVARIAIDLPLIHLDRPFDYLVPEPMSAAAQPGVRVRVRLAGQKVDGYVLERAEGSEHEGRLAFIESVVSPEPVLSAEVFALARQVADHYIGTIADVLRLAIPPRHARVEAEPASDLVRSEPAARRAERASDTPWAAYPDGAGYLAALRAGHAPRAVMTVPPPLAWTSVMTEAVHATVASGRGVVVIVPDRRDADLLVAALQDAVPADRIVHLAADVGPAERYRRFLRVSRGSAHVVVGSRAAAFAPVHNLGLVVVWDDGDDLHAEPRAPYPHVREVLAMRARAGSGLLIAGRVRTAEGERLVRSGWAAPLVVDRAHVRATAPEVRAAADDVMAGRDPQARAAHLPSMALRALQDGLARGPVLVQVPRAGYVPVVRCQTCRTVAGCTVCGGPLRLSQQQAAPACGWCGREHRPWSCGECGGDQLRVARMGARRTAEELGRAFPGIRVVTSGRDGVVATVADRPALVIATPGAEPVATGAYAAVALLDGDRLLDRPDLRAGEEALRRWSNAVALCRSRTDGGQVVIAAEPTAPAVQALVRTDPDSYAAAEFDQRLAAHMPPAARLVTLTGAPGDVEAFHAAVALPVGTEVLGPMPVEPRRQHASPAAADEGDEPHHRLVLRVPLSLAAALTLAVRAVAVERSAAKQPYVATVVDPIVLD